MRSKKRSQKKRSKRNLKNKLDHIGEESKNNFFMVSLKGCPYCISAKEIITNSPNSTMTNLDLNMNDTEQKKFWNKFVQTQFKKKHDTFPKIFKKGKFIGGCSELQEII